MPDSDIDDALLSLTRERGPDKSICPTDAAKVVAASRDVDWHTLLQPVKRHAVSLALRGQIVILRKGKPVDPQDFRGVYRLAAPRLD